MSTKNSWIASIACAFGLAASAQAVDLFKQTELPDQGFGSDAYWTRTAGGIVTVYGSVRDSQGRRNAFLWDLDNDGVMSSGPFPSMVGMEAESVGGAVFANGMEVAIGRMYPAGDPASSRAVLWRKPPGGAWSLPTSLFGSMRSDLGWGYATSDALKWAGWIEIDSVMRPVVFEVTDTLGATTHFLQSPPGGGAALRLNGPGAERVVGWATFPSGYMRASAWDLNSDGLYGIRAGGFGDAVSSLFLDVTNASGAGAALGTALRGQRSLAFLQSIPPTRRNPWESGSCWGRCRACRTPAQLRFRTMKAIRVPTRPATPRARASTPAGPRLPPCGPICGRFRLACSWRTRRTLRTCWTGCGTAPLAERASSSTGRLARP
jgi:hypothetical protein